MSKKILIIDDEYDSVMLLQMRLESHGFEVYTAYDGLSGIDAALSIKPDVIMLDLMMPIMDGYETAEKLRETPETAKIPIFVFTAAQKSKVRDVPELFQHFIPKPFDFDEIIRKINEITSEPKE